MGRTSRTVAVALTAVLVGVVSVATVWSSTRQADDTRPGVPDRVHAVPDFLGDRDVDSGELEHREVSTDLAVGRGALAWVSAGIVVVVDADDGAYHLLDLPDPHRPRVHLSPDGRFLAFAGDGVQLVDLETGLTTRVSDPLSVRYLDWSPDGRWLAWVGPRGSGRISAAGGAERLPLTRGERRGAVTVSDDGVVGFVASGRLVLRDGAGTTTTLLDLDSSRAGAMDSSPDGSTYAAGGCCGAALLVDTATGEVRGRVDAPLDSAYPLGWLDDETSVWQTSSSPEADGALLLVSADGEVVRRVASVEDGAARQVSVATDVMSPEAPTVRRPEPDFPWSPAQRWTVAMSVAATLLVVLGAVLWWRRRSAGDAPATGLDAGGVVVISTALSGLMALGLVYVGVGVVGRLGWSTLMGPVVLVVLGCTLLTDRRRRAWGVGLVLGPPVAVVGGFLWLVTQLGS